MKTEIKRKKKLFIGGFISGKEGHNEFCFILQWKLSNVITDNDINWFIVINWAKANLHFLKLDRYGVDSDIVLHRIIK